MYRRRENARDVAWVTRFIQTTLQWAPRPLTRDRLSELVLEQQHLSQIGVPWTPSTAGRRVREALSELRRQGQPVLSVGKGFKLAATAAERHQAAEKLRKTARSLLVEAMRLENAPVPHEPVQETFPEFRP